jgi:2-polyprenyl-3-methyl-5-hydroxy-6-metoxy-1,4-benzoquinol methylase
LQLHIFIKGGNKILDIGCGTDREAMALAKFGYKVFGTDISEKEIELVKEEV